MALDNGLARAEVPNAISVFSDKLNIQSSVLSIARCQERLYAATHLGLYYLAPSSFPDKPAAFQKFSGITTGLKT